MQRTIRAGRDVVAGACLDVKFVEEFSLSTAHSPAAAAPDTTNSEIARDPEVGSMADGLDMNGLWVYSHGRLTPTGSLHRSGGLRADVGLKGVSRHFDALSLRPLSVRF